MAQQTYQYFFVYELVSSLALKINRIFLLIDRMIEVGFLNLQTITWLDTNETYR